jgi:hypothetical protein
LKDRARFSQEAEHAAKDVRHIGVAAEEADRRGRGAFTRIGGAFASMAGRVVKFAGMAAGIVGIGGLTVAMVEGVKGAMNYQKIQAQTASVVKSAGGAAGVSAGHVAHLAKSIMDYSAFSEEAITKGENLLLTFTSIRNAAGKGNDVFDQTTKTVADMATALGEDTTSAAMQLGKALNDPIKGVNMLRRVGVSFTSAQIEQVKAITKAHGAMAGQKMMLKELQNEFGGSAKAVGETFAGKLERARNRLKDFTRDLAMPLMDPFSNGLEWASGHVLPKLESGLKFGGKVVKDFFEYFKSGDVEPVHSFFGFIQTAGAELGNFWQVLAHGPNAVAPEAVDAFTKVAGGLRSGIVSGAHAAVKAVHELWHFATTSLIPTIRNLIDFLTPGALEAFKLVATVAVGGLILAMHVLGPALVAVSGFLKAHKTAVTSILIPVLVIVGAFKAWTIATKVWAGVTTIATKVQSGLNRVIAMNPYVRVALLIIAIAAAVIYAYKHSETFRRIVQGAFRAVENAAKAVWNWLKSNWPYLLAILMGPFGLAVGWIIKHWTKVRGFFTGLPGVLKGIGSSITDALFWPFKTAFNMIAEAWNNTAGRLHFHVPGWVPKIGGDGFSMPTIPTAHQGGTVRDGGLVNMRPGEEIVALPTGATVVPLPPRTAASGVLGADEAPHIIQLVVDGKVLAESTHQATRARAARL